MRIDPSEVYALSANLGKIGARSTSAMFEVFRESGKELRDQWKANATTTAGRHGKHYPKSITMDMLVGTDIGVEVGPDPRLPQGGMSFEYGSMNQPPHLDGQLAADTVVPRIGRRIDAALAHLGL